MPSVAFVAFALLSSSLVSAIPVPQNGPWWHHSSGSWPGSWHGWTGPSGAPEWSSAAPAIPTAQPTAPGSSPAGSSVVPTIPSSVPSVPSAQPEVPSSAPYSPPSVPSAGSSPAPMTPSPAAPLPSSPAASPESSPAASPAPAPSSSSGSGSVDTAYYPTPGSGTAADFHSFFDSKVVGFEDLWSAWESAILTNNNNDATAVGFIHDAIASQSASSGISGALLLSVIMQESSGAISTVTTGDASGGSDGGMMQCGGCPSVGSIASATAENVAAMIAGGVAHFQGNLAASGNDDWTSLRLYNSGSLIGTDLSNPAYGPASTPAYVEMVANRMHGWIH